MFMFWELFIFGAVLPFCIFKLLPTKLKWTRYVICISVSLAAWYSTQSAILALLQQGMAKYTLALKLHVRNNVNYRAKDSEDTENNQDGFHNEIQC